VHYLSLSCPFVDPVLLRFGPLTVSWYGLMYCAGGITWYLITRHELIRRNGPIPVQALPELLFYGLVGAVIGARLGYVLFFSPSLLVERPWEVFAFWHGGMSAHGSLVGISVTGLMFVKQHRIPFRELKELSDIAYLGIPIGLMLVKIGNFVNCEGFGRVTTLPWGVIVAREGGFPRHPAQLYEAALEGLLLFTLLWRLRLKPVKPGDLSCFFFIGYGVLRFLIEFSRDPDHHWEPVLGWFTLAQILSLCVIAVGVVGYALPRLFSWAEGEKRAGTETEGNH
jgi:phosphatidylglycerol---prolipoprotein diacylglyceryl transferase